MMTKKTAPYLFLLPMVILFAIFMVYPVINSLILSFQDFTEGRYVFCSQFIRTISQCFTIRYSGSL